MSRLTPDDRAFMSRAAVEFNRALNRALDRKFTMDDFVAKLGVTKAAYYKYINRTAIPSLRVLQNARKYWGVRLTYGELGDRYIKTKRKDPRQMELQLSFADISPDQIEVKRFTATSQTSVELLIRIDFSKSA